MANLSRNETLQLERETIKLKRVFDGLKNLRTNRPAAVLVLDAGENIVSIKEAEVLGIPVIALANTSTQYLPQDRKFTVICNNNSTNLVKLLLNRFSNAYNNGLTAAVEATSTDKKIN